MIDLKLKDDKLVIESIEKLRAKGNINDLPTILDYLVEPANASIEKSLYNFIFDIKDAKAVEPIITAIQNEKISVDTKEID